MEKKKGYKKAGDHECIKCSKVCEVNAISYKMKVGNKNEKNTNNEFNFNFFYCMWK